MSHGRAIRTPIIAGATGPAAPGVATVGPIDPCAIACARQASWPPIELLDGDGLGAPGWTLRFSNGYTSRANSASYGSAEGSVTAHARKTATEDERIAVGIAVLERAAADRVLEPVVVIDRGQDGLDRYLARRGYVHEKDVDVLTKFISTDRAGHVVPARPASGTIAFSTRLTDEWLALFWSLAGRPGPGMKDAARRVLGGADAFYLTCVDPGGDPVGVSRVAVPQGGAPANAPVARGAAQDPIARARSIAIVSCVAVAESARRRGHARALTRSAERVAASLGARWIALEVEGGNAGATALYGAEGFVGADEYHYRRLARPATPPRATGPA